MARKEKTIGTAQEKRRYDLPMNRDEGTGFLLLLIGLMAFLGTMAMASSFTLAALAERWKSGLEDRVTIEIPAQDADGNIMKREEIAGLAQRIGEIAKSHPAVAEAHILTDEEIAALVQPWMGNNLSLDNMPLPELVALTLRKGKNFSAHAMEERIKSIAPGARLDAHESWLKDVLRFTGALQLGAALLSLIIGVTTVTAVAGAIRARMAVHREEVGLLHLMGAPDSYIARQFQHHSMMLGLKGGAAGTAAGVILLLLTGAAAGKMDVGLLPGFHLGPLHFAAMAGLPLLAALIATLTARQTVYHALEEMP
jgi:cell division transport system permease protein